jgi:hypothetical protein
MSVEIGDAEAHSADQEARRVHDEYRLVRAGSRTGIELYFSKDPVPAELPVYVFQHTMKTAGTAVRALIHANLSATATYVTQDAPKSAKHVDLTAWYRDLLAQYSAEEQARLLWAVGHTAAYVAPLLPRPARIFTIVREPVDQVVSRHWFAGFRSTETADRAQLLDSLRQIFASTITVKRKRHEGYWNLQSQSILAPYYDVGTLRASKGPTPDAEVWRQRLSDVVERSCVLLLQDRLDEAFGWFAEQQQWTVAAVPKVRINRERPAVRELDAELRATIAAYNWLDVELYQHALRRHARPAAAGR